MGCRENDIRKDSMVFYRSWYEALNAYGKKTFCDAFKAILEYAFNGTPIESHGLSAKVSALLNTFLPIIDKNIEDYRNGCKGAKYGYRGGRPRKQPQPETGGGFENKSPNDTDSGTDNDNENETVSVNVTDGGASSPHTNFEFYIPVFFFRNARCPERQAKKFVEHYAPSNWKLTGGELMATDQQRVALAQRWDIRDDSCDRFKPDDLAMWKELYEAAPLKIQTLMISQSVKLQRKDDTATIIGPRKISEWIEANLPTAEPIVRKWLQKRKLSYAYV